MRGDFGCKRSLCGTADAMRPRWGLLWLLGAAASCLTRGSLGSPRIIRVTYSSATEACPGLPPFTAEGYVDNQLITRYESHTRKLHPRVDWINTLEKEDFEFYNTYTRILKKDQKDFQENVQMLQKRYNQSGGFHIVQMMISCQVGQDGSRTGHWQYGYDGRDFLGYEMKTGIWTAVDKEAQVIKRKWEKETAIKQRFTGYLESTCREWLQKNDHYRSEASLKEVPPVVTMSSRAEADGMERHVCHIHGFYPREIDASWTRDGEVWDSERGSVAPNSDGTYYYFISIQIDPKERGRYRCHVEHDGLKEPLDLALKVPESNSRLGLIIGLGVAGLILVCAILGILAFLRFRRREDDPRKDPSCISLATEKQELSHQQDQASKLDHYFVFICTPPLNNQLQNTHLNLQQNSSESEIML